MRPFYTTVLLQFLVLAAHGTVLNADGLIKVRGDGWQGTRITVIPEFSAPYEVDLRSNRFKLRLPLQSTYLVRAEHANCPTKEVVFDLHMPRSAAQMEYEFPFEIMLEVQPDGVELRYAGPVGLVTYEPALGDFTYSTDHRLIAMKAKTDELRERATPGTVQPERVMPRFGSWGSAAPVSTTSALLVANVPAETLRRFVAAEEPTPAEEMPPRDNETGSVPSRHGPSAPSIPPPSAVTPAHDRSEQAIAHRSPSPPARTNDRVIHRARGDIAASAPLGRTVPAPVPPAADHEKPVVPCGSSSVETVGRMVIAVHWVPTGDGGCKELRSVAHAYGAVFHFHDGRSVTESFYRQALGR